MNCCQQTQSPEVEQMGGATSGELEPEAPPYRWSRRATARQWLIRQADDDIRVASWWRTLTIGSNSCRQSG